MCCHFQYWIRRTTQNREIPKVTPINSSHLSHRPKRPVPVPEDEGYPIDSGMFSAPKFAQHQRKRIGDTESDDGAIQREQCRFDGDSRTTLKLEPFHRLMHRCRVIGCAARGTRPVFVRGVRTGALTHSDETISDPYRLGPAMKPGWVRRLSMPLNRENGPLAPAQNASGQTLGRWERHATCVGCYQRVLPVV